MPYDGRLRVGVCPQVDSLQSRELLSAGKPGTASLDKVSEPEQQGYLSPPNYQLSLYSIYRPLCVCVYWCVLGLLWVCVCVCVERRLCVWLRRRCRETAVKQVLSFGASYPLWPWGCVSSRLWVWRYKRTCRASEGNYKCNTMQDQHESIHSNHLRFVMVCHVRLLVHCTLSSRLSFSERCARCLLCYIIHTHIVWVCYPGQGQMDDNSRWIHFASC